MESLGQAEYLCYRVLSGLQRRKPFQTSRTRFHKISSFADHYLNEELDQSPVLPRYWFMYGETLDDHAINRDIFHAPEAIHWEGQQYLPSGRFQLDEFEITTEKRRAIDTAVDHAVASYWDKNADELRREQYRKYAPNEFVAIYSELRDVLSVIDLQNQFRFEVFTSELSNKDVIINYLDRMLEAYPENKYSETYDAYLVWDDTVRLFLEEDPDYDEVEHLLNSFIRTLSLVELRLHHSQNIPKDTLVNWREERYADLEEFKEEIRKLRAQALEGYELNEILTEELAESFDQAVLDLI